MAVLTVGNFDGVHLGHQAILTRLIAAAQVSGVDAAVLTFVPHPRAVLAPESAPALINTYNERKKRLEAYAKTHGASLSVHEQPFGREFSAQSPAQFLDWVWTTFSPTELFVGHDFQFGRDRSGTESTLRAWSGERGVKLHRCDAIVHQGAVVSSSRVRAALMRADFAESRQLLGYEFSYDGVVVHGEGRGRQLGIPTANVKIEPKLLLPTGVYAVRLGGRPGVANFGVRPTFGPKGALGLECHLFEFGGDLYGHSVHVEILAKIRDEKKFASPDELKAAIARDLTSARQVHASLRSP